MSVLVVDQGNPMGKNILGILEKKEIDHNVVGGVEGIMTQLGEDRQEIDSIILENNWLMGSGKILLGEFSKNSRLFDVPLLVTVDQNTPAESRLHNIFGGCYWLDTPLGEQVFLSTLRSARADYQQRKIMREQIDAQDSVVGLIKNGTFQIRTFEQAENLTTMLSLTCPEPDRIAFGLFELLVNAIEHGNLEIHFEDKRKLIAQGRYREELNKRLAMRQYKDRSVKIDFERTDDNVSFYITDQGDGFDPSQFMELDLGENHFPSGRGIAMAKATSFDQLEYSEIGNQVMAITKFYQN